MHEAPSQQLMNILIGLVSALGTALIPIIIAWVKARAQLDEQKTRAAVLYVEALTSEKQNLSSEEKKALAIKMINPAPTYSQQAVLGEKIEEKLPQVTAELERITKPD